MEALFTLTVAARKISGGTDPDANPMPEADALPYAVSDFYTTPRVKILSQRLEGQNYCMELFAYDVTTRLTTLGAMVSKPAIIFCYALDGQVRSLSHAKISLPDLKAGNYAGYSLPGGHYRIQLGKGTHAFFYFAFEINYLVRTIRDLPNLSSQIQTLLSPPLTFQILPICKIDFGVTRIITQMQTCPYKSSHLDLQLTECAWNLLKIYEGHLQAGKNPRNKTPSQVAREVHEYISQHFKEPGNDYLPHIANRFHINEKTLSRTFKNVFGITIHQRSIQLRMELALRLLRKSSSPISTIATETGYPDIYSFSRAFKKHFGYSPREARKRQGWSRG